MANKTAFVITNKEKNLNGVISNIDEKNIEIVWEDKTSEEMTNEALDTLLEDENFECYEVSLSEQDETADGGTPAANTIKTHKSADANNGDADGNPKTRFDWVRKIVGNMANMDVNTLTKIFNDQQAMIGGEAERAGLGNNAAKNAATIKMKPSAAMESVNLQKEEMDSIFAESELTEETKTKLTTLFEAAVMLRLTEEVVRLQEVYETKLKESIDTFTSEIKEDIDTYFNHITEEWLKENEVAIESTLKNELTEDFLTGLHSLFKEHYIAVPEDRVDIYENVKKELEISKDELNKSMNESMEKDKLIASLKKTSIVAESTIGLTIPQRDKLVKLVESVDFDDEESFKLKIKTLKEGFIDKPKKDGQLNINEENLEEDTVIDEMVDPMMELASKAISKNLKFSNFNL
jgi:hypothetical protein